MRKVVVDSLVTTTIFFVLITMFGFYSGDQDVIASSLVSALAFLMFYGCARLLVYWIKRRNT
jgi:hypothetical protein